MTKPVLAIHGGAGAIARSQATPEVRERYEDALRQILQDAGAILTDGGTALDAVTEAVRLLEECPLFNAGHGAVFTSAGTHELDAAIMDGSTLQSGAVAGVSTVRNPVLAARAVMEQGAYVFLMGSGAETFAHTQGIERVDPTFFSTEARRKELHRAQAAGGAMVLDHDQKLGTVGAVALDCHGNLAAATSTGGLTNKLPGRIGDTPLIGAGCYANNRTCAVSTTGTGEKFIRMVAAYDVSAQMEYAGRSLDEATRVVVHEKLPTIGGDGGLIAVDAKGNVSLPFNTGGMYRGYIRDGEKASVAIH